MELANQYGNNSSFASLPSTNPFTARARSLYGTPVTHGANTAQIRSNVEGLFPMIRPLIVQEEASPWQWWDPNSPIAQTVVSAGPPPITAHQASLASNPDMSATKGRTYLDTVMGYLNPRIVCAVQLGPCSLVGIDEVDGGASVSVYPNPATENVNVVSEKGLVRRYRLLDINGRLVASGNPAAQRFVIERNGLNSGTYLVELELEQGRIVRKLMLD
ncbi:MAG: T9SS type A sorting domain-containing protein [Flavobacteriales bacterium]|nr:T9SS type A sorting domain-containing protein [Flavobacteriales bacterium]